MEYARQGIPIVGTSTSCTLTLKEEAPELLDMYDEDTHLVARKTYDFNEFLLNLLAEGTFAPISSLSRSRWGTTFPASTVVTGLGSRARAARPDSWAARGRQPRCLLRDRWDVRLQGGEIRDRHAGGRAVV